MDKKCGVPNCTAPYLCKNYCSLHYQRFRKYGDPLKTYNGDLDPSLCSRCQKNGRRKDHSWCQSCLNELSSSRYLTEGKRFYRYGLSKEDLYYMWIFQGGRCDICKDGITIEDCHVDHDNSCCSKEITREKRSCGKCVRSLLCGSCNQGLGNFKDSPERLEKAISYLERMKEKNG